VLTGKTVGFMVACTGLAENRDRIFKIGGNSALGFIPA
jgi:hypothetical protein